MSGKTAGGRADNSPNALSQIVRRLHKHPHIVVAEFAIFGYILEKFGFEEAVFLLLVAIYSALVMVIIEMEAR